MGIDVTFGKAYAKAAIAAGQRLPQSGNVFITMMDKYKETAVPIAKELQELGFGIMATYHTASYLRKAGLQNVQSVLKVSEGRPNGGGCVCVLGCTGLPAANHDLPCRCPPPTPLRKAARCSAYRCCLCLARGPKPNHLHTPAAACAEDLLKNGEIQMMIITTAGDESDVRDGKELRRTALAHKVPIITTLAAARATVEALKDMSKGELEQVPLQDYF